MLRHSSKPPCAAAKNGCRGMLRLHMLDEVLEEWQLKNALGRAERTYKSQTAPLTSIRVLVPQKNLIIGGQ